MPYTQVNVSGNPQRHYPGPRHAARQAASEQVLWRMGMNMSQAVELFLRKLIVEERIPFEIATLGSAELEAMHAQQVAREAIGPASSNELKSTNGLRKKDDPAHTKFRKIFPGRRTPSRIQRQKTRKRG